MAFPHVTRCFTIALLVLMTFATARASAQTVPKIAPRAVVLQSGAAQLSTKLATTLTRAGYRVEQHSFEGLEAALAEAEVRLLALPAARVLPHQLHAPLEKFLARGGDIVALGLPAWQQTLLKFNGSWMLSEQYARQQVAAPPQEPLQVLAELPVAQWERASDQPLETSRYEIVQQAPLGPVLHAVVGNLTSWDTIATPQIASPFAPGRDRFVFSAKGGPESRTLSVEWRERDNSRWIAVVTLTPQWRRYELAPSDFRFYHSVAARAGDHFRPENATRLSFGIAFTHGESRVGRHEWWVANLGTASAERAPLSTLEKAAPLDGLYPAPKTFRISDPNIALRASASALFPWKGSALPRGDLFAPHPRPAGSGFAKERHTRMVPLLEAHTRAGELWRGAPGALYVHAADSRYRGGRWAVFGITDNAFLGSAAFQNALQVLATRMRGPLLFAGGSDWYTSFPNRTATLGAQLSRGELTNVTVQIRLTKAGRSVWQRNWKNAAPTVSTSWQPAHDETGAWQLTVALRRGGVVVDEITQQLHVWNYPSKPNFITAQNGQFLWKGQPWKAHGVNYMPSSGIARDREDDNEFEFWLDKAAYDPAIVGRDLDNIKRLGLNSISAFIYSGSRASGNLLDLIRQCEQRGLKINLSLRPGTPIDWDDQWAKIRPIIEEFRLSECDTVFAYDLAWEPSWGNHQARRAHDDAWAQWVNARYGSVAAAEKAWQFAAPRENGKLTNPSDYQVSFDGEWRALTIDYRRFLGDLLRERYGRARRELRALDPNHLVSFRMSETGNPTFQWDAFLPYDFPGLERAIDFWAPEAYGRMGDWEKTRPGWFQTAYARALGPQLPLVWAEVGLSAWVTGGDQASPDRLQFQAESVRHFYRMMRESGANGIFFWWNAGGLRTNEASDYGILNPDGTDRPVSRVIRDHARAFLAAPAPIAPDATVGIRLWQHAAGPFGIYQDAESEFWKLVAAGQQPGLKIEK